MAIDTAEKRRSVGGVPFLPLGPNVTPNVAKDAQWRQQVGWSYSGIAAGTEVEEDDELPHSLPFLATVGALKTF